MLFGWNLLFGLKVKIDGTDSQTSILTNYFSGLCYLLNSTAVSFLVYIYIEVRIQLH